MNSRSRLSTKLVSAPHVLWAFIFMLLPLFLVLYYAFTDASGQFTFDNIAQLPNYQDTFMLSIWLGILATVICLVLAYPMAYIISQSTANVQRTMILLVMLPMWMNLLIRTYSWMIILENNGVINTLLSKIGISPLQMINTQGAVVLGMVYNFLPYMILPIYTVMVKMDKSLIEACADLGGSRFHVISKVIFPLSLPGVISGLTMVFVPSVSTFYISQKLGGPNSRLIGDVIEQQFKSANNYNLGAAISLVLMVLILISMAIMSRFSDEDGKGGRMVI